MRNLMLSVILIVGTVQVNAAPAMLTSTNTTTVEEQRITRFATAIVSAIDGQDRTAILDMLHPSCRKVAETNQDVRLFVDHVMSQKIPAGYTWKANNIRPTSALLGINRWVVQPSMCLDIMWQQEVAGKTKVDALSIFFAEQNDKLVVISYMNDYLAKKIGTPRTSGGR